MKVDNLDVTLYKTVKGITRVWRCYTLGSVVYSQHGLLHGEHQLDSSVETTPERALSVAKSKIAHKQIRQGYSEDINANPPGSPMLLHNYRMYGDKLPFNVYYQAKLDGHRCIGSRNLMVSRQNDLITSMPHIQKELTQIPKDVVLDGELYCHGLNLQDHSSMIRRHDPDNNHKNMTFFVFDVQMKGPYRERLAYLTEFFQKYDFEYIKLLESIPAKKQSIDRFLDKYIKEGYEGVIVRSPEGTYATDSRTYQAQKYKPIYCEWFKLIDFVCAEKGREKNAAIAMCETSDGSKFRARMTGDVDLRRYIYKNRQKYLPAIAKIEFADYTEKGIPQHPRCVEYLPGGNLEQEKKILKQKVSGSSQDEIYHS